MNVTHDGMRNIPAASRRRRICPKRGAKTGIHGSLRSRSAGERSRAVKPSDDLATAPYLVIKVIKQDAHRLHGGNWGMDDAIEAGGAANGWSPVSGCITARTRTSSANWVEAKYGAVVLRSRRRISAS